MRKIIVGVEGRSIAEEMGISAGDLLLSINDSEIKDVFDYRLLMHEAEIEILIEKPSGEQWLLEIDKDEDEDIGLVFDTGLMDDMRNCTNNCVFCFVHQNPKGVMRDTIYFKDDDYRLSFLHGNYITLTNMDENDVNRILAHRLSPINVSVHTTDPALRAKMMGNNNAAHSLKFLRMLADGGISLGLQIVLCKDINDGAHLDKTITDLAALINPQGSFSLSVVPAGLTRHRRGLPNLQPFSKTDCRDIIKQVEKHQQRLLQQHGTRFVFCADEFYVNSGLPLPPHEAYEDFAQIENGVGMLASFKHEYSRFSKSAGAVAKKFTVVTGPAAKAMMHEICDSLKIEVATIRNDFFGHSVNVAGLITGGDIINQLKNKAHGRTLLIPSNMLRTGDDVFLDNLTPNDVARALNTDVTIINPTGTAFAEVLHK